MCLPWRIQRRPMRCGHILAREWQESIRWALRSSRSRQIDSQPRRLHSTDCHQTKERNAQSSWFVLKGENIWLLAVVGRAKVVVRKKKRNLFGLLWADWHHFDNIVYCYPTGGATASAAIGSGGLQTTLASSTTLAAPTTRAYLTNLTNLEWVKLGDSALD